LQINSTHPALEAVLPPTPRGIGEISRDDSSSRGAVPRWAIPAVLISLLAAGVAWFVWHDMPMPMATSKLPMDAARKSAEASANTSAANATAATAASGTSATSATSNAPSVILLPPANSNADATARTSAIVGSDSASSAASPGTTPSTSAPLTVLNVPTPAANTATKGNDTAAPKAPDLPVAAATASAPPSSTVLSSTLPPVQSPVVAKPGQKRLSITFAGRSWTEIRSKGDVVFSEMASIGTREVAASTPISFVVGNASNVSITVDGKPYDFSGSVRNEVARFRIE
jgi:cytoskeleton protein RodZ